MIKVESELSQDSRVIRLVFESKYSEIGDLNALDTVYKALMTNTRNTRQGEGFIASNKFYIDLKNFN